MTIAGIAFSLLLAVTVHEAAHALVLRRLGIPISHAGLGLPFWPILTIRVPSVPFRLTLSPWLVGAYVRPDEAYEDQIDALPYRAHSWFLNAGIVANAVLGFALVAAAAALQLNLVKAVICLIAAAVFWLFRRAIAAYVLPALSVPALAVIVYGLSLEWAAGRPGVGLAGLAAPEVAPNGLAEAVGFAGAISLSLALVNMLPLFGLDNGKVVDLLLHRWGPHWFCTAYQYAGVALVLAMIAASFGADLWAIATALL